MPSEPLVTLPATARPPLSVRRKPADAVGGPRPQQARLGPLDRDLLENLQRIEEIETARETHSASSASPSDYRPGAGRRIAAAALDAVLLGGLSAAVIWITLRWSELPVDRMAHAIAVLLPTASFLVLVVLGYLLMFTAAGGQTVGKMALGLRVVGEDLVTGDGMALTTRQATYRSPC